MQLNLKYENSDFDCRAQNSTYNIIYIKLYFCNFLPQRNYKTRKSSNIQIFFLAVEVNILYKTLCNVNINKTILFKVIIHVTKPSVEECTLKILTLSFFFLLSPLPPLFRFIFLKTKQYQSKYYQRTMTFLHT